MESRIHRKVFLAGGTGYVGRHLIPRLLDAGHDVTVLVRPGWENKAAPGCTVITGDVFDRGSYRHHLSSAHTFVQLVGVAHPSPSKARQFVEIDQRSAMESIQAARGAGVEHFIYVSVAQPAPVMKEYLAVRASCEAALRESGMNATILRPWYVLGPGHYWPYVLVPVYRMAEKIPSTAEGARRLGLITISQMARALVYAVEHPANGATILDVPAMRAIQ